MTRYPYSKSLRRPACHTTDMVHLILLVFALVLFILGAWPLPARINLMSAGLACWVAAELFSGVTAAMR